MNLVVTDRIRRCVSVHTGRGVPQYLVPFPFRVSGPRSILSLWPHVLSGGTPVPAWGQGLILSQAGGSGTQIPGRGCPCLNWRSTPASWDWGTSLAGTGIPLVPTGNGVSPLPPPNRQDKPWTGYVSRRRTFLFVIVLICSYCTKTDSNRDYLWDLCYACLPPVFRLYVGQCERTISISKLQSSEGFQKCSCK